MNQSTDFVNILNKNGFYFRYRPYSELSIKEMLYHEIFFASVEESDDPYEGFLFVRFEPIYDKWIKFLSYVWNEAFAKANADTVARFLCNQGSISLQDLKSLDFSSLCELSDKNDKHNVKMFRNAIDSYSFRKKYFACFSRNCGIDLMWSHYADKHKGFCLIFRPERKSFSGNENAFICFDKEIKKGCKEITFEDVKYTSEVCEVDGFALLPTDNMRDGSDEKKNGRSTRSS